MRHRCGGRGAMPVLLARLEIDNIARPDLLDRAAFPLNPSASGGDDQCLSKRVRMPRRTSAWLECDACPGNARRLRRAHQGIDTDRAGEVLFRPFPRGL